MNIRYAFQIIELAMSTIRIAKYFSFAFDLFYWHSFLNSWN